MQNKCLPHVDMHFEQSSNKGVATTSQSHFKNFKQQSVSFKPGEKEMPFVPDLPDSSSTNKARNDWKRRISIFNNVATNFPNNSPLPVSKNNKKKNGKEPCFAKDGKRLSSTSSGSSIGTDSANCVLPFDCHESKKLTIHMMGDSSEQFQGSSKETVKHRNSSYEIKLRNLSCRSGYKMTDSLRNQIKNRKDEYVNPNTSNSLYPQNDEIFGEANSTQCKATIRKKLEPSKCPTCNFYFENIEIMAVHNCTYFRCLYCETRFKKKALLDCHVAKEHATKAEFSMEKANKCFKDSVPGYTYAYKYCGAQYKGNTELSKHLNLCDKRKKVKCLNCDTVILSKYVNPYCTKCKALLTKRCLEETTLANKNSEPSKKTSAVNRKQIKPAYSRKQTCSNDSGGTFSRLEDLLNKLPDTVSSLIITDGPNFKCIKCGYLSNNLTDTSKHYQQCELVLNKNKLIDISNIRWACTTCHTGFENDSELVSHKVSCTVKQNTNSILTSLRENFKRSIRYYCTKCGYGFTSSHSLPAHECEQKLKKMKHCFVDLSDDVTHDKNSSRAVHISQCFTCSKTFYEDYQYQIHVQKDHAFLKNRLVLHQKNDLKKRKFQECENFVGRNHLSNRTRRLKYENDSLVQMYGKSSDIECDVPKIKVESYDYEKGEDICSITSDISVVTSEAPSDSTVTSNNCNIDDDYWKCNACDEIFNSLDSFEFHVEKKHKLFHNKQFFINSRSDILYCTDCHISFKSSLALQLHGCKYNSTQRISRRPLPPLSNLLNSQSDVEIHSLASNSFSKTIGVTSLIGTPSSSSSFEIGDQGSLANFHKSHFKQSTKNKFCRSGHSITQVPDFTSNCSRQVSMGMLHEQQTVPSESMNLTDDSIEVIDETSVHSALKRNLHSSPQSSRVSNGNIFSTTVDPTATFNCVPGHTMPTKNASSIKTLPAPESATFASRQVDTEFQTFPTYCDTQSSISTNTDICSSGFDDWLRCGICKGFVGEYLSLKKHHLASRHALYKNTIEVVSSEWLSYLKTRSWNCIKCNKVVKWENSYVNHFPVSSDYHEIDKKDWENVKTIKSTRCHTHPNGTLENLCTSNYYSSHNSVYTSVQPCTQFVSQRTNLPHHRDAPQTTKAIVYPYSQNQISALNSETNTLPTHNSHGKKWLSKSHTERDLTGGHEKLTTELNEIAQSTVGKHAYLDNSYDCAEENPFVPVISNIHSLAVNSKYNNEKKCVLPSQNVEFVNYKSLDFPDAWAVKDRKGSDLETSVKRYICPKCYESFYDADELALHFSEEHQLKIEGTVKIQILTDDHDSS